jgi:hypothetical protein
MSCWTFSSDDIRTDEHLTKPPKQKNGSSHFMTKQLPDVCKVCEAEQILLHVPHLRFCKKPFVYNVFAKQSPESRWAIRETLCFIMYLRQTTEGESFPAFAGELSPSCFHQHSLW